MEMSIDPVCGMKVKEKDIASEYSGNKYYFCSDGCKTNFDANPEKYTGNPETNHNHGHGHGGHC